MGKGGAGPRRRLPSLAAPRPAAVAPATVTMAAQIDPGYLLNFEVTAPLCLKHRTDIAVLLDPPGTGFYLLLDDGCLATPSELADGAWCDRADCHLPLLGAALCGEAVPQYRRSPQQMTAGPVFWQAVQVGIRPVMTLSAIRIDADRGVVFVGASNRRARRIDLTEGQACTCPLGHLSSCAHREVLATVPLSASLMSALAAEAPKRTTRVRGLTPRGTPMGEVLVTALTNPTPIRISARLEPAIEGLRALRISVLIPNDHVTGGAWREGDIAEGIVLMEGAEAAACESCAEDDCPDLVLARAMLAAEKAGRAPLSGTATFDANARVI